MSLSKDSAVESVEIEAVVNPAIDSSAGQTYVAPEPSDAVKELPFQMLRKATVSFPTPSRDDRLQLDLFVETAFQSRDIDVQSLSYLCLSLKSELEKHQETDASIAIETYNYDFSVLNDIVAKIDKLRIKKSEKDEAFLKSFFVEHIIPLTNQSKFCRYAYEKPRGYAGDFVMMDMIWNGRTKSKLYKFQGESSLGKIINAYTLDIDNCKANEWRIKKIASELVQSPYKKIASIGSGSAIELEMLFFTRGQTVESIDLFDQDSGALKKCVDKYAEFGIPLHSHEGNIVKSILRNKGEYDFLYSSGMFDYFNLESSQKLIRSLWDKVVPGGKMLITNANPESPSRLWLELVGDWYLLYKSQQEMLQLIWELPNIEKVNLELDPYKVYQYISVSKL